MSNKGRCLRKIGEGLEGMKLSTFFRKEGTTVMIGSAVVEGPTMTDLRACGRPCTAFRN